MKGSNVEELVIHAVYLLNCASEDPEIRDKSLASLIVALNAGAQLKAKGVVLHPGSALKNGGSVEEALKRAGKVIKEALAESETCPLLLEDTAGAGGTLGRSFEELATMIEVAGGQKRLGVCLDSCHLFASGYDVRTRESLGKVIDEFDKVVGCDRLGALHVNDSMTGLGSNRDRHVNLGDGEIGVEGMIAFLSRAALRGPAGDLRRPGALRQGDRPGRHGVGLRPALARPGRAAGRRRCGSRGRASSSCLTARGCAAARCAARPCLTRRPSGGSTCSAASRRTRPVRPAGCAGRTSACRATAPTPPTRSPRRTGARSTGSASRSHAARARPHRVALEQLAQVVDDRRGSWAASTRRLNALGRAAAIFATCALAFSISASDGSNLSTSGR